ncbi:amidohydrolase family protein [Saccharothrix variisporea]|uniref:Cytosine/adenosine deaminase-related metal-dependent hydrolase n=1 Tax=Saccharothrix variisporea TaxID=543527 RepID=A0A495XQP3_9PSEU|nr:amidohydrolase family protein [Saccharothrix variisporea]RKT74763.1 cytosine/adenosine deaminase-related metal-dependent hydrolase [Saccharothrix variisporea]
MGTRTVLRGGVVLSMDPTVGDFDRGDVLVEDGAIVAVGRDLPTSDADVLDCTGKIVLPGFVNTHHHMFQTALRSYWADALDIDYFLQSRAGDEALFHQYTPEDVYWGEFGGALENLSAGTTTVVDTSQCSYTPEHTDAALDGIRRAGIRSVFSLSPVFGDHEPDPRYAHPDDIHRILAAESGLIRPALGYHVDEDLFRLARDLDVPMFAHVNDGNWGRVLEEFETDGLLGPAITYIHCLGLADSSWQAIERTGGKVSVSCIAEQTLAMGRPALQSALDRRLPVGFGTDAVSIAPVDFFSQMRAAYTLQRGAVDDSRTPVSTRDILHMATLGGAQAAHLDHLVGSLTPGKRADVIVLNARALNAGPLLHAPGTVLHMDTGNVETVLVDGRIVKADGRLVDVDVNGVLDALAKSAEGLLRRSGARSILLTSCRAS